jgi:hypothetical protein
MRLILILFTVLLVSCGSMPYQNNNNNTRAPQIAPDNTLPTFPIPQSSISRCIRGTIDEMIAGGNATVIWYQGADGNGLTNVRLPMNHPVRIRVSAEAFCYDYFDVSR